MLTISPQSPISAGELDNLFTALGNAKRREMVLTLAFRPTTVGQLAVEHQLSLPAIHRHIRVLENAELIQRKKVGVTNFLAIKRVGLQQVLAWLGQFHTWRPLPRCRVPSTNGPHRAVLRCRLTFRFECD